MNCFKFIIRSNEGNRKQAKLGASNKIHSANVQINDILVRHGKTPVKAHDQLTLGALILEILIDFPSTTPSYAASENALPLKKSLTLHPKKKVKILKSSGADSRANAIARIKSRLNSDDGLEESNELKNDSQEFNDSDVSYFNLIIDLLESKLIEVNNIKNFLNQTLLHFACEYNNYKLCRLLLNYGACCLTEDNYRQTPFILASKRNYLDLVKLFSGKLKQTYLSEPCGPSGEESKPDENVLELSENVCRRQIRRATYQACCLGNLEIAKYLFETFKLTSEQLIIEPPPVSILSASIDADPANKVVNGSTNFSELNCLHVACYKANLNIVEFLLAKTANRNQLSSFINRPINEFRDCTSLEEAFKGYLTLDLESNSNIVYNHSASPSENDIKFLFSSSSGAQNKNIKMFNREIKKANYQSIINLLIENGGKFSNNFIANNGLFKLLTQMFYGPKKDIYFVHFLYCCNYLFKFNLSELFVSEHTNYQRKLVSKANTLLLGNHHHIQHHHSSTVGLNESSDLLAFPSLSPSSYLNLNASPKFLETINETNQLVVNTSASGSSSTNVSPNSASSFLASSNSKLKFDLEKMLDELLFKIYLTSVKVVKDYKMICLTQYIQILFNLHYTGQISLNHYINRQKLNYLKERNNEIYTFIRDTVKNPLSLKTCCFIAIRRSMKNFGLKKIDSLDIPKVLKYELFFSTVSVKNNLFNKNNIYYTTI